MQSKLVLILVAILALAIVEAQVPALSSLSSKIASISASDNSPARPTNLSSAISAYSRISAQISRASVSATAAAQTQHHNAATALGMSNTLFAQVAAMLAVFVASFVAMLA